MSLPALTVDSHTQLLIRADEPEAGFSFTDLANSIPIESRGLNDHPWEPETTYKATTLEVTDDGQTVMAIDVGGSTQYGSYYPDYLRVDGINQGNNHLTALQGECWVDGYIMFTQDMTGKGFTVDVILENDSDVNKWTRWMIYNDGNTQEMRVWYTIGLMPASASATLPGVIEDNVWHHFLFERHYVSPLYWYKFYWDDVCLDDVGISVTGIATRNSYLYMCRDYYSHAVNERDADLFRLYKVRISDIARYPSPLYVPPSKPYAFLM